MYFPYLRGKQNELLALKDFSQMSPNNAKIVPIIEPVKNQVNGLNSALETMIKNGMRFALILNPKDGDFKRNADNYMLPKLKCLQEDREHWIPAYFYKNNADILLAYAEKYNLTKLMVVFPEGTNVYDNNIMDFLSNERVRYVVNGNSSNSAIAKLRALGKNVISLEDHFNSQNKNADYASNDDEFFSDDFLYYKDSGFYGFADYTALPKNFVEGGMLPYAIAIHLTYKKSDEEVYVHHFVSDSNLDQSNIRGKFREAAIKIDPFYKNGGYTETAAVMELVDKANDSAGYPGLGYIKKLSIKNHLELIDRLITE